LVLEGTGTEGTSTTTRGDSSLALVSTDPPASPTRHEYPVDFEEFWRVYPRKVAKAEALKAWRAAIKRANPLVIEHGALSHAEAWSRHGYEEQFIPHPSTWLRSGRWEDDPPGPRSNGNSRTNDNLAKIQRGLERSRGAS
jgi:hypothetical protein